MAIVHSSGGITSPLSMGHLDDEVSITEAAVSSIPDLEEGELIGDRYRVDAYLGAGGMGKVLRVTHVQLGRPFALKLLRGNLRDDPDMTARFRQEAKIISSVKHPNLVSVVDFGEDRALGAFMVMEAVDGIPLSRLVEARGTLPIPEACDYTYQIAHALAHLHARQILHCDLKPANVLVCRGGPDDRRRFLVKVIDFGLAHLAPLAAHGRIEGTPEYMAPERFRGSAPTVSTDIYALGVLCYELLSGRRPFEGALGKVVFGHINEPPEPLALVGPAATRAQALIMRALQKEPVLRQASAIDFVYELDGILDLLGRTHRRVERPVRPERRRGEAARLGFDLAPVPMAWANTDGTIVAANAAFAAWITGAQGSIDGLDVTLTPLATVYPNLLANLRRLRTERKEHRELLRLRTGDGCPVDVLVHMRAGHDDAGDVHLTIQRLDSGDDLPPIPSLTRRQAG